MVREPNEGKVQLTSCKKKSWQYWWAIVTRIVREQTPVFTNSTLFRGAIIPSWDKPQKIHKMLKVININRIEFYHILKINKSVQSRLFNTKPWDHSQFNKECWRTIPGLHQLYLKWGTVLGEAAVQDELYSKQKKQHSIEAILSGLMSNG